MSWLALGGATVLQLLAGLVRVRGWFHVIRHSSPEASRVRYRDVALAQLGGCGWNAVLPARAGDAVKVALVSRRLPEAPVATLASTLVAPALVDAVFTALLVAGLLAVGPITPGDLAPTLPGAASVVAITALAGVAIAGTVLFRSRLRRFAHDARAGLALAGRPRFLATRVVPWQLASRALRLVALALVLTAAGMSFGIAPALALMALQGAAPSVAPAATAMRVAMLAGVFAAAGAGGASAEQIAAVMVAWYAVSSITNLTASATVTAWELRTVSPRRIVGYARSAIGAAADRAPEGVALARPARAAGAPPD
jgi:Lysylphosphatidylglycerol synthase TM region